MISTVSILGVDDSVSPLDLADISQKYPFVEWGINLCAGVLQPEFPSGEWLEELLFHADRLRLRGILHGRWEGDILAGNLSLKDERPLLWDALQRIQIDIRLGHQKVIEALQIIPDKEVVLTTDNPNSIITGINLNAHPLFPSEYLRTYPEYCGYSLVDNTDCFSRCKKTDNPFWISVRGFRSDDGITMDLLKVERFLDIAEDYVTENSWFKALLQTEVIKKRFSEHP